MWCTQNTKGLKVRVPSKSDWSSGYATAQDGHDVYDIDVVKFILQHTRFLKPMNTLNFSTPFLL